MKLYKVELLRLLISKSFLGLCSVIIIGTLLLGYLYEEQRFIDENGYMQFPSESYIAIKKDMASLTQTPESLRIKLIELREEMFGAKLLYTGNVFYEIALFEFILEEIRHAQEYTHYLDVIQHSAKNLSEVSLFSENDSFSYRNIQKTAKDYAILYGVVPVWGENVGIKAVASSFYAGLLFILGILYLAMQSITNEKYQELLLRTTVNGRASRITAKITTTITLVLFLHTIQFTSQLLFAHFYYGLGDMTRPMQSVFESAPYRLTVWQALLLIYIVRFVVYALFVLIFYLICIKTSDAIRAFGIAAIVFGVSAGLYVVISPFSEINLFKYVNLIYLLNPEQLIYSYVNINLFGYPVNLTPIMITFLAIFIPVIFICTIISPFKPFIVRNSTRFIRLPALFRYHSVHILKHEAWKLLWANKVIFLLIGFIVFQAWKSNTFPIRVYPDEVEYRKMVEAAQLEPEPLQWAQSYRETLMQNGAWDAKINAISRVIDQLRYLESIEDGELIYDTGYNELLGDAVYINEPLNALLLVVMLVLTILPVREWEMGSVLRTTFFGRGRLFKQKIILAFLVSAFIFVVAYLPDLLAVLRIFGLTHLNADVLSFPWLTGNGVSLFFALAQMYTIRLLTLCILVIFILCIPAKTKTNAVVLLMIILVLPLLLALYSLKVVDYYPVVWLLS